jgi:hypothetical protein
MTSTNTARANAARANAARANEAHIRDLQLSDIIAEYDCTLSDAARSMGIGKSTATVAWQRICARLGPQCR